MSTFLREPLDPQTGLSAETQYQASLGDDGLFTQTSMKKIMLKQVAAFSALASWQVATSVFASPSGVTPPSAAPSSSTPALAKLDQFVKKLTRDGQFSGVVLVSRDGMVLHERAYGHRAERLPGKVSTTTRFNLASAGKMFTSVAILQHVASGRISLDTTIGEVLTDFPNKRFAEEVTIRHLLTHTGGAGGIDLFGVENAANRERVSTVEQSVALHANRDPAFEPGSKQEYGNYGYVVLGRIVEVLSSTSFDAYIAKNIFARAGMIETAALNCKELPPDVARGYVTINKMRRSNCETQPRRGFPAGGQISSARDMLRFVTALQGGELLPRQIFAEATRTQREFMGLGFFATGYGPGIPETEFRWGHAGSSDGICTDVRTYPATKETVIVLTNRDAPVCFAVSNAAHEAAK